MTNKGPYLESVLIACTRFRQQFKVFNSETLADNFAAPAGFSVPLKVHDSVLLEVPVDLVEETSRIVRDAMETPPDGFMVPLKVDIHTGRTWADCKETKQRRASE